MSAENPFPPNPQETLFTKEKLRSLFEQGQLIGLLFVERTGKDLTIERIPADGSEPLVEAEGINFHLLHRVNSAFEDTPVGRAATFWSGSDEAWQKIKGIRMSRVLHDHGLRIVECSYDENRGELHRKMLSKVGDDYLLVEEWLLLDNVVASLNKN